MKGAAPVVSPLVVAMRAAVVGAALLSGCGGGESTGDSYAGGDSRGDLFAYDSDRPLDAEVVAQPPYAGDEIEAVTYVGADDGRVPGFLGLPPSQSARPCVIHMHGFGRSKEDAAGLVGPLAGQGIGLLAIDAPSHGARSQGSAELERLIDDPRRLAALLEQTVIDLRRGLDLLESRRECDPDRLGFIGFSFGAETGALLAGADGRVQSSVLLSGGAGWKRLLHRLDMTYSEGSRATPIDTSGLPALAPYAVDRSVSRIAPRPVLIVNGRDDEVIPAAAAEALHRAAGRGSTLLWHDGGHDPFAGPQAGRVAQAMDDFLRRTLAAGDRAG
jgi:dienelactone hydrolase